MLAEYPWLKRRATVVAGVWQVLAAARVVAHAAAS